MYTLGMGVNMNSKETYKNASPNLKNISSKDFLNFGLQDVAYIRQVRVEDRMAYVIHAADGTPLTVMDSQDTAIVTVRHNDLEPVTLH
jgi:hypothetical protein